ncbi:hypothetical protein AMAG_18916 [Allomyces macrogynus ATCC 38327]|uniref:Uncharacterized protein n=1 Tax=Allomyces macrogynus (strain ATCC 38327) TaxID=578462 RepID=A0A0L0SK50_ALLM3|nr:hypothetical protein AMAG_18916 [Allomyces macrogynus ATCC 38327]|eukprot:KNE62785.1 hypothetical protein AMAG_18916 [Allomyces macrogynus ATCC 38327]
MPSATSAASTDGDSAFALFSSATAALQANTANAAGSSAAAPPAPLPAPTRDATGNCASAMGNVTSFDASLQNIDG